MDRNDSDLNIAVIGLGYVGLPLAVALARREDVDGAVPSAARLSLLVLLAFLLLFEARARYLVLYLPLVLLMATLTLDAVVTRVVARVRRAAGTTGE